MKFCSFKWLFLFLTVSTGAAGNEPTSLASGNTPAAQQHADATLERLQGWGVQSVDVTFEGFLCVTTLRGGVNFRRQVLTRQEEAREAFSAIRSQAIDASGSVGCVVYASSRGSQFAEATVRSFLDRRKSIVYFYSPAAPTQP